MHFLYLCQSSFLSFFFLLERERALHEAKQTGQCQCQCDLLISTRGEIINTTGISNEEIQDTVSPTSTEYFSVQWFETTTHRQNVQLVGVEQDFPGNNRQKHIIPLKVTSLRNDIYVCIFHTFQHYDSTEHDVKMTHLTSRLLLAKYPLLNLSPSCLCILIMQ